MQSGIHAIKGEGQNVASQGMTQMKEQVDSTFVEMLQKAMGEGEKNGFQKEPKLLSMDSSLKTGREETDSDSLRRQSDEQDLLKEIIGMKDGEVFKGFKSLKNDQALKLDGLLTASQSEIIGKISDYLIQNGIKHADSLEVFVEHDNLGRFKISAQKSEIGDHVDLKLEASSKEGLDFFSKNETRLVKQLAFSGVKVSDFKISPLQEGPLLSTKLDGGELYNREHLGEDSREWEGERREQGTRQEHSQRRRQLWEMVSKFSRPYGANI